MNLVLDPEIRNWVLIPLCVIIFLVQALRTYLLEYVKPKSVADIEELKQKYELHWLGPHCPWTHSATLCRALVARSQRSRMFGGLLSRSSFENRKVCVLIASNLASLVL